MDLLLLAALRVRNLDREALVALPAVRARRERAGHERGGADEARVGRRERDGAVVGEHGRRVRDVDVQRQGAVFETTRTERSLSAKKRESETNRIRMRVEKREWEEGSEA